MTSKARARRVADRIAQELAILLQRKAHDPRLRGLSVTGVDVDRELARATIFISSLDNDVSVDETMDALSGARGFFRSQLASLIPLRSFPQLRFRYDSSIERGDRIERILTDLESEKKNQQEGGSES
jgi:ribosome-binding factor A